MDKPYIIGVTGGIGAGKTAVTDVFEEQNVEVVDADVISRNIVAKGSDTLSKVAAAFGEEILTEKGELNRSKLREIIFADEAAKITLNQIMHPAIREAIERELYQAKTPYVILSAPLLLENGLDKLVSRVLVVDVPEETQLSRASSRDGVSVSQIGAIMQSQISRSDRLLKADDVLDNSGVMEDILPKVMELHAKYLQIAADNKK